MFVLINRKLAKIMAASEDPNVLGAIIEERYPNDPVIVLPVEQKRGFAALEGEELAQIMTNTMGVTVTTAMGNYSTLIDWMQQAAIAFAKKEHPDADVVDKTTRQKKRKEPGQAETPPPKPPVKGSVTGELWAIFNKLYAMHKKTGISAKDLRVLVLKECSRYNPATVNTQFSKWKKQAGL